jgi:hypothetical protein
MYWLIAVSSSARSIFSVSRIFSLPFMIVLLHRICELN